jgi:hypothetical protein
VYSQDGDPSRISESAAKLRQELVNFIFTQADRAGKFDESISSSDKLVGKKHFYLS